MLSSVDLHDFKILVAIVLNQFKLVLTAFTWI